jgi:hypothetical protein
MPLYYNHHATIFVPAELAAPLGYLSRLAVIPRSIKNQML